VLVIDQPALRSLYRIPFERATFFRALRLYNKQLSRDNLDEKGRRQSEFESGGR
jgi:hypothetical protein